MKAAEIRKLGDEELKSKVADMRRELFNLRFQAVTGEIQNPLRIRTLRKDIARAKTIANARHLQASHLQDINITKQEKTSVK